jgi:putative membrane protein
MGVFQAGRGLYTYSPYCGAPPEPATLLSRWNFGPIILKVIATFVVAYAVLAERGSRRRSAVPPWRRTCFYSGWALAAAALISPPCALTVSLFSARVSQHMVVEIVAAPLVALGRPAAAFASSWRGHWDDGLHSAQRSGGALAAALWCWQALTSQASEWKRWKIPFVVDAKGKALSDTRA